MRKSPRPPEHQFASPFFEDGYFAYPSATCPYRIPEMGIQDYDEKVADWDYRRNEWNAGWYSRHYEVYPEALKLEFLSDGDDL